MTNNLANRILIAFMKRRGIRHVVLSSGTRNIPFCNAVETDDYFTCYSIIDERNAPFFAMGISQQINEPVALACTSGTAASNYLTGITEAFYGHIPLVAITFDRNVNVLGQLETQKIDQPAIFQPVTKKSVCLPILKDEDDLWYFERLINEAFIAMEQHGNGPIHLNVPMVGDTNLFYNDAVNTHTDDKIKFIDYINATDWAGFKKKAEKLGKASRVMIVMGQMSSYDPGFTNEIKKFCKRKGVPVICDNLANFKSDEMIFSEAVIKALNSKTFQKMIPEIVITLGANFQERIKDLFKANKTKAEHWAIEPEGMVKDVFKSETALFECKPLQFFQIMNNLMEDLPISDETHSYLESWRKVEMAAVLPEMPFTNFYAIGELARLIPVGSTVHYSILNATRLGQFFQLDESVKAFSNVNSFGIDGCLPTFMGQAYATDKLAFLIIGDLSFFYGMNAASIKHRKNNIRIMLINNGGGAEFHIQPDSNEIPTIDLHIGAAHNRIAKGWVESIGYEYLTANDKKSLSEALKSFVSADHEKPVMLEVFTNMRSDGEFTLHVYRELEKAVSPVLEEL